MRARLKRWAIRGLLLSLAGLVLLVAATRHRVRLDAPDPTRVLTDRHGRFLAAVSPGGALGYWPVDPMPHRAIEATLAIEDQYFRSHPGVNPLAVGRAVWQNLRQGERVSGASTIAMQVARMQSPAARTWSSKALEAATAVQLVLKFGHDAVLRHYLRLAPYGNNVHGVGYAARFYFDRPVEDLSWAQTAYLAGIPQSPARLNPHRAAGHTRAKARAVRILDALFDQKKIDEPTRARALAELAELTISPRPTRPRETLLAALSLDAPENGPLRRTTLDLDLQRQVLAIIAAQRDDLEARGATQVAALVVERDGFAVRAAIGNLDAEAGLDFLRTKRSPGSTIKPFLFARALDVGVITPTSVLDDLRGALKGVGNADGRYLGPLLPRVALGNSRNVPVVSLFDRLGHDTAYELYEQLGLLKRDRPVDDYGALLAIGGFETRPVDLAAAYTAFADDGHLHALRWFDDAPLETGPRVFSAAAARTVVRYLADPVARQPTFPRMSYAEYPFPVALKTGTSGGYRDGWMVALTPRYLALVWVGRADHHPMRRVTGFNGAGRIMKPLLEALHPEDRGGLTDVGFPPPEGARAVRICATSGQRASPACPRAITEHLKPDEVPEHACEQHVRLEIDRDTGALATADTQNREAKVFYDMPARYADWLRETRRPMVPGRRDTVALDRGPTLRIVSPHPDSEFVRDPEATDATSTVLLQAAVEPRVPQVVWWIDGEPVAVADWPYSMRWPLEPGVHTVEAKALGATSGRIRMVAR